MKKTVIVDGFNNEMGEVWKVAKLRLLWVVMVMG